MDKAIVACALLLVSAVGTQAGPVESHSLYTDISERSCAPIPASGEPGDEEDGLRCRGPAGYELLALSGDLRASITLVAPGGTQHELNYWGVVTHAFSSLGPRAEWRVRVIAGKTVPHALIVRVIANEDADHPERRRSYLAVAKITPQETCVTARVDAGADDNAQARIAADAAAARPCLGEAPPGP